MQVSIKTKTVKWCTSYAVYKMCSKLNCSAPTCIYHLMWTRPLWDGHNIILLPWTIIYHLMWTRLLCDRHNTAPITEWTLTNFSAFKASVEREADESLVMKSWSILWWVDGWVEYIQNGLFYFLPTVIHKTVLKRPFPWKITSVHHWFTMWDGHIETCC